MKRILKKAFEDRINSINTDKKTLIVLKGIPAQFAISGIIDLDKILKNKLMYFFELSNSRNVCTYEEFLLLNEFILSQYSTVYVINNNLFMEQYPLELNCSKETKKGLLTHFTETEDIENDDSDIGDIEDIVSIFVGLCKTQDGIIGVYCDETIVQNDKIEILNLFDTVSDPIICVDHSDVFLDIVEETDYIRFITKLSSDKKEITIRTSNYIGDKYRLTDHIKMAAHYLSGVIDVFIVQAEQNDSAFQHRDEYTDILNKYWGYLDYRELPVYDTTKLEAGEKTVIKVSQEKIISDIVEQVENCESSENGYRDIFVTAPTGAGKSVMFQIPAIYLAEKSNLLTIVISPLIGLMNDQVKNLELKNYKAAETINSDISPIIKEEITEKVASGECHILYLSPETLLSRSDVVQLIGDRTIGMIVVDEAHIVTTWGKQFRPDYWYLGDHIQSLRKNQLKKKGRAFVIATFTATAIYHGIEDMYTETINSLHMIEPITYLGYIRRNDIQIRIEKQQKQKNGRNEYELDKLEMIQNIIKRSMITNKKTLIYFPTVALINRCYEYLRAVGMVSKVGEYHGSLTKDQKLENYEQFYNKEKLVMLATKAFGMGIDINDIELIVHFAPTGNVCDYVQEIGRAARKESLTGEAYYKYDTRDFKHINRLHGLSTIKKYQLLEVINKIIDLYSNSLKNGRRKNFTKKRNAMLLDAENFSYIFGTPISDEDENINKVKTALLIIQKDFESRIGFSPINVRPVPLFSQGYFEISENDQARLKRKYPNCLEEINNRKHICRVVLDSIWKKDYSSFSFPKFKFLLYSKDPELDLINKINMNPALCVGITFADEYHSVFSRVWGNIRTFINNKVVSNAYTSIDEMASAIQDEKITKYKARSICEVIISSMNSYRRKFTKNQHPIAKENTTNSGETKYQFQVAVNSYFDWVKKIYGSITSEVENGELYLINDGRNYIKEVNVVLGILEAIDVLSFNMIGGANSQLYIYINQIQSLRNIKNKPASYQNKLLDDVADRHLISVKMLTYLYENDFTSDEIWNYLEDYFLGKIPETVKSDCLQIRPKIDFDR